MRKSWWIKGIKCLISLERSWRCQSFGKFPSNVRWDYCHQSPIFDSTRCVSKLLIIFYVNKKLYVAFDYCLHSKEKKFISKRRWWIWWWNLWKRISSRIICNKNVSTFLLLYMTEDIPKNIELYRRIFKINGKAIAWDVLDVCDEEIMLEAIRRCKRFRFFISRWRNDDEKASRAIQLYPENKLYTNSSKYYNLRNTMDEEN